MEVICSSFSKNSVVPDFAMVPRLISRSCFVMPWGRKERRKRGGKEGRGEGGREGGERKRRMRKKSCVHVLYYLNHTSTQIRQTDKPTDSSICDVQDMVIGVCLDPDGEVLRGTQSRLVCQREETNLVQCI